MSDPGRTYQHIQGVSLPAFLQLLEHERASCTLTASSGSRAGSFFFQDGRLADARIEDKAGLEAVHALLSLKDPVFLVGPPEDRMTRIFMPLARILLHASEGGDAEELVRDNQEKEKAAREESAEAVRARPALRRLMMELAGVPSVRHYYLISRKGVVVASSSKDRQTSNFISYAVMSSLQMRKSLGPEVRGPYVVQAVAEDGGILLILPGAGMIMGLLLDDQAPVQSIVAKIRAGLRSAEREAR